MITPEGEDHVSVAVSSETVTWKLVGVEGGETEATGVTAADAVDAALVPLTFLATTVNV